MKYSRSVILYELICKSAIQYGISNSDFSIYSWSMYVSRKISGFSLIEVLFAWWILSSFIFLMLSIMLQQSFLIKSYYYRAVAVLQLKNILVMGLESWEAWNQQNKIILPSAHAFITCDGVKCQICLKWQSNREKLCVFSRLKGLPY
jgi:hypothetical protein